MVLRELLYGFAPLTLRLGAAPLIAAVIWGFSIYAAVVWAEEITGRRFGPAPVAATGAAGAADGVARIAPAPRTGARSASLPAAGLLALVALFMVALPGFYEPFLATVGMARWQEGTRTLWGVPWIALVGYPALAVPALAIHAAAARLGRRPLHRAAALATGLGALAVAHAWGLQALKRLLGG